MATFHRAFPGAGPVEVLDVAEPDPRLPLRPVGTQLWRYRGTHAEPAVAPPSDTASAALAAVAHPVWGSPIGLYEAVEGPAALPVDDLLALIVHPPRTRDDKLGRAPATYGPDSWVRTVQAWCCAAVGRSGSQEPWQTSRRRAILLDLLDGPVDWVTETAALAMVAVAWAEPATRADVGDNVARRFFTAAEAMQTRDSAPVRSLALLVLACPWLDREVLDLAQTVLDRLEHDDEPTDQEVRQRFEAAHVAGRRRPWRR